MTLAIDAPVWGDSLLGRLDGRWKLAAFSVLVLSTAFLQTLPAAVAAAAGAVALAVVARIRWSWLLRRLGGVALALLFFLAWLPFTYPEAGTRWRLGVISISPAGLVLALLLLLKALTLILLVLTLVATAPLQKTCAAAHALRVPGVLVHLVLLTHRFVFLAAEEFSRLRTALRVRGFRSRANRHSYHTIGQVTGTLLVRSHDRAERVAQAMCCRGFDGRYRSLQAWRTRLVDVASFAIMAAGAGGLLAWDFLGR
jgi:cobalt/nickel transport system permease protein